MSKAMASIKAYAVIGGGLMLSAVWRLGQWYESVGAAMSSSSTDSVFYGVHAHVACATLGGLAVVLSALQPYLRFREGVRLALGAVYGLGALLLCVAVYCASGATGPMRLGLAGVSGLAAVTVVLVANLAGTLVSRRRTSD